MEVKFVDLNKQYISLKNEIDEQIKKVISETAFITGKYVSNFEREFSDFVNTKYCVGVSNGTDSIYLGLKALDVKENDEVILPVNTFIATAESICRCGAKPVFIDIDEKTYNIDLEKIEGKITSKTKVIIPVHLYGLAVQMDKIKNIAEKHNLKILEDCAQAHGAEFNGKKIGSFGDCNSFSFYPGKNLGAFGDAGAVTTDNENLFQIIKKLFNHGRLKKYEHEMIGYNHRMDGIQAAILSVKLKYLDDWNKKRQKNASLYYKLLDENKYILPYINENSSHVFHLFVIQPKQVSREKIMDVLKKNGIQVGIHYPIPLNLQPAFDFLEKERFPIAEKIAEKIISLPMHPFLEKKEIEFVSKILNEI